MYITSNDEPVLIIFNVAAINIKHSTMQPSISPNDQFYYSEMSSCKSPKQSRIDSPRSFYNTKKRLRWAETSTVIVTARKTSNENKASWYNKQDIRLFKRETKDSTVSLIGSHDAKVMKLVGFSVQEGTALKVKAQNVNCHGLEHLISREVCYVLCQSRWKAIAGVLEEQERQRETGDHDVAKIASVSTKASRFAVQWRQRITDVY